MDITELIERRKKLSEAADKTLNNMQIIANESGRVTNVLENSEETLDHLDYLFKKRTKLTKPDIVLLFLAIGLQVARQYLLTNFKNRVNDQEAANNIDKNPKHSDRHHRYYDPSLEEIKTNPVPFDALNGANGALSGGGKFKHRGTTLGHDPILGLVFGTANIATSTLTTNTLQSYHITTNNKKDFFKCRASTIKIFEKIGEKITHQGLPGWEKLGLSLALEIKHLITDLPSKDSLPLPFLTLIDGIFDTSIASDLAKYGFDMSNVLTVGKQATLSIFINSMIAMLHRILYKGENEEDYKLHEVRTRKIIMYSNIAASASNIIACFMTERWDFLYIGGIGVTIYRIITDSNFIRKVKKEFVYGTFDKMIGGEDLQLADVSDILDNSLI